MSRATASEEAPKARLKVLRIAAIVMTLIAVTFISVVPQVSNDFWLQAKVGEIIFHEHAIPSTVLFPFTEIQAAKFNAHEWLPSLLFFGLVSTVGEAGLPLVLGLAGILLFALALWLAYRRSDGALPLALLSGLVAVGVENFRHSLRPELISLFILGIYWLLLDNCRRHPSRPAWLGALLMVVVWSNTHGSFVLAPIIAGIFAVGVWIDSRRSAENPDFASASTAGQFAIFTVAALACTLVNPFGLDLLKFVFEFSNSSYINQNVVEWYSIFDPRIRGQRGLWIGIGCASILAVTALIRARRLSAVDALMLLLFLLLTLRAIRFVVYLGMVFAYVLPPLVSRFWSQRKAQLKLYALCTTVSALVFGLSMAFGNAMGGYPYYVAWNPSFTRPMVDALADPNIRGNVLNDYDYGGELVFRAYPRLRPSIDSRIDSYGPEYYYYHQRLLHDEALFTDFVARYDVRYLLMSRRNFLDFQKFSSYANKQWSILLIDQKAVLLERHQEQSGTERGEGQN